MADGEEETGPGKMQQRSEEASRILRVWLIPKRTGRTNWYFDWFWWESRRRSQNSREGVCRCINQSDNERVVGGRLRIRKSPRCRKCRNTVGRGLPVTHRRPLPPPESRNGPNRRRPRGLPRRRYVIRDNDPSCLFSHRLTRFRGQCLAYLQRETRSSARRNCLLLPRRRRGLVG